MRSYNFQDKFDDEDGDKIAKWFLVLLVISFIAFEIFDYLYPKPSLDIQFEAKETAVLYQQYEQKIQQILIKYYKVANNDSFIQKKFNHEIKKINTNLKRKKNLQRTIDNKILKEKERDKEEEHLILLNKFYEIDDLETLNKIYHNSLISNLIRTNSRKLKEEAISYKEYDQKIYNDLTKKYNKLNNPFAQKKQTLINTYFSTIQDTTKTILELNNTTEKNHEKIFNSIKKRDKTHEKLIELNHSRIKILKDMDIKFYIQIGRSSWNSHSDDRDKNILYDYIEVSRKNFLLAQNKLNQVITNIKLNRRYQMPSHHDSGEFWLNDKKTKYLHKYTYLDDYNLFDKPWEEVNENFYWNKHSSLGMEIYSKPFGYFNNEASHKSLPIGGNFVGNPIYGKWGNNLWIWNKDISATMKKLFTSNYTKEDYNNWQKEEISLSSSTQEPTPSTSSGGGGIGNIYYSTHDQYWEEDKRRYERKLETIRGTSSSHTGRGVSAGGK